MWATIMKRKHLYFQVLCGLNLFSICLMGCERINYTRTKIRSLSTESDSTSSTPETTYALPAGAVVAFNSASCPSGDWTTYSDAAGRILIGSGSGNTDADATALTSRSIGATGGRTYTTGIPASTSTSNTSSSPGPTKNLSANSAVTRYYDGSGSPSLSSLIASLTDSNMPPFIALTYCKKTAGADDLDAAGIAPNVGASCDADFPESTTLRGRFIVGAGSGNTDADSIALSARAFGATGGLEYTRGIPAYNNTATSSIPGPTLHVSNALTNVFLRDVPDTTLSGSGADSNMPPYVSLTACESSGATGAGIPSGTVLHFDLTSCPSGWTQYTAGKGRAWLAAGTGNTDILGSPLTSRTVGQTGGREYTTGILAVGDLTNRSTIATDAVFAINGSENLYTTDPADTTLSGAKADSNMPPYIVLLQCSKD